MIYQCTKDMLKALKKEPDKNPDIYNDLFAWNVKLMKVNRRNLVYFMNDASKLSVILHGMTVKEFKDFDYHFKRGLKSVLEDCNVSNPIIHQYLDQSGNVLFTSTGTRKQLGVLNRAAMDAEYFFEEFLEYDLLQRRLCERQNDGIVKNDNGDYVTPKVIMKNLLEKAYGGNVVKFDLEEIANHMFMYDRIGMIPFLNIRDGNIRIEEERNKEYEDMEYNDDYVCIRLEHFDFFSNFKRFVGDIKDMNFQRDLNKLGHGKGAVGRIKELLLKYPDVENQWYEYKDQAEQKIVKEWLESLGLM